MRRAASCVRSALALSEKHLELQEVPCASRVGSQGVQAGTCMINERAVRLRMQSVCVKDREGRAPLAPQSRPLSHSYGP
eukprot:1745768-Pyramimonas_sp.AAC.1